MNPSKNAATLPGLPVFRTGNKAMDNFIDAVREHLEVRQGARGDPYERALTLRDLTDIGLMRIGVRAGKLGVLLQNSDGSYSTTTQDEFTERIFSSRLYQQLVKSLKDPTRFENFPKEVQDLLLTNIAEEAEKRGAEIRRLDSAVQSAKTSLATAVQEVTAAVNGAVAGVRQTVFASASDGQAAAGIANQINLRLDSVDGADVSIEELLYGSVSSDGLLAQYTLKLSAGGAFAGIGLAAEDNLAGTATSKLIFVADNMAFVGPGEVIGTGPGQVDPSNPGAGRVPFAVDATSGVVYINGTLRVNANGPTLASLATAAGIAIKASPEFFKINATGAVVNTTVVLTAELAAGLTGNVTWSHGTGTTATPPSAGTTNTWTINAASQTADTAVYTATYTVGGITYTDDFTIARLRDGASALTGMLTNEAHTLPTDSDGVVTSYTGASGTFRIYRGTTLLSSGLAFSVISNPDGITGSVNATTGAYAVTGTGTWANSSNVTQITVRCVVTNADGTTTTIEKVFTLSKAKAGSAGAAGLRGSLNAYGTNASLQRYPARPSGAARWSIGTPSSGNATAADTAASTVIWNALLNAGSPPSNAHLRIGDQVTLSTTGVAVAAYWDGSKWAHPGTVIDGNLLVQGSVAAESIAAGTITGTSIKGASEIYVGGTDLASSKVGMLVSAGEGYLQIAGAGGSAVFEANAFNLTCNVTSISLISSGVINLAGTSFAGTLGLQIPRKVAGPTTGSAVPTFAASNKPGSASTNQWLQFNIGGSLFYIPCWT